MFRSTIVWAGETSGTSGVCTPDNLRSYEDMHVEGDFYRTDEMLLLLDPEEDPLKFVGGYLIPGKLVGSFTIGPCPSQILFAFASILNIGESENGLELGKGVRTSLGIILANQNSYLPLPRDFTMAVPIGQENGLAADDDGGLYSFSLISGEWRAIESRIGHRVRVIRPRKPNVTIR